MPERPGVITQMIPIGGQIRVAPNGVNTDLNQPELDAILNQQRIYGLLCIDELDTNKSQFSGLVYSIGKPLTEDKLRKAMIRLEKQKDNEGKKLRSEAALAVNNQIENRIGTQLKNLEMSFTEEEPRGGYAEDITHLSEGVRVTREADVNAPVPIASRRGH